MDAPPHISHSAPRKSRKGLVVTAVGLLLAGVVAAGMYFYIARVQFEPSAHKHVPPHTMSVLRADGVKLATFRPVREHLWPLLLHDHDGGERPHSARVKLIKKHTGIGMTDLREVVVAMVDVTSWVVLVGGTFEPGRFVPGMEKVFSHEGQAGWKRQDNMLVNGSLALAQADDGTLIVATQPALAKTCLPPSDAAQRLPVPVAGAISFAVDAKAYRQAVAAFTVPVAGLEALQFDALKKVDSISGHLQLSDTPSVQLDGVPRQGETAASAADSLKDLLSTVRLTLLLVPLDFYGSKRAIANAKVSVHNKHVRLTTEWPYRGLDKAVRQLASIIGDGRMLGGD